MARRDLRRHRGRSVLVLLMVGVPTALLALGLTLYPTSTVSGAERIPFELGSAVARIDTPSTGRVTQDPEARSSGTDSSPAKPLEGYSPEAALDRQTRAIGAYFGGRAVPWVVEQARVAVGDRSRRVDLLVTDGRAGLGAVLTLVSGRWPQTEGEVAVSSAAVDAGLPSVGRLSLTAGSRRTDTTVVGVVDRPTQWGPTSTVVTPVPLSDVPAGRPQWLLLRPAAVPWSEVREANTHGMTVLSAAVLRDPPALDELDPTIREWAGSEQRTANGLLAAGGAILLLVTTLLVGPAFAVSAARQRRTLAIAAANGATTRQLRRSVLAQAVLLGVLAAAVGTGGGVLGAALLSQWVLPATTTYVGGPLEIPVPHLLGVTALAMLSAVVAALLPARRLGRLDIVGVMKGQNVSPRPSRVLPGVGLVGALAGGTLLFWAVVNRRSELPVVLGAVLLVGGALCLVPLLVVVAARFAAPLPVQLRMATRDAARQRTRSVPTVAAVVGAVAALTMLGVGLSSDTEQQRRDYQPQNLPGEATVYLDGGDREAAALVTADLHRVSPALAVTPSYSAAQWSFAGPPTAQTPIPFVNALPPGCTTEHTVRGEPGPSDHSLQPGTKPRCQRFGTMAYSSYAGFVALDATEIGRRLGLDAEAVQGLREGGAVVVGDPLFADSMTVVRGSYTQDPDTGTFGAVREEGRTTLLVVAAVPLSTELAPRLPQQAGVLVTPETARGAGWPISAQALLVHDPEGPIGTDVEERANAALEGSDAYFGVERGFQRPDHVVMSVLVGVFAFLILVVTLTSTALSLAEQRRDDATLAALGATRRTRRGMAAAQAFVLAAIGAVVGLAVGLVPGVAITYPLTGNASCDQLTGVCSDRFVDPVVVVPWPWLGLVVVGVPVLGALIAAAAVRRAPVMTRRTA